MIDCNKLLIIYNPNAMKGKIENFLPKIKERLSLRYPVVDACVTSQNTTAEELAYRNAGKYDIIVSCGGDGTLHYVINGIKKSNYNPIVAVLPFGTCNDVARTLKLPLNVDGAIDAILRLNTIDYDLMYDGENYTVYTLATGYLTNASYMASEDAKRRFGRFAYFTAGLKVAFRVKNFPLTIKCDNEQFRDKFIYFMMINGEHAGGMRLNPKADLSNHKTQVVMIKHKNRFLSLLAFIKMFLFGLRAVKKNKRVILRECENIDIENHSNIPFTIDGEKQKFLKKHIDVKQSIRIVVK